MNNSCPQLAGLNSHVQLLNHNATALTIKLSNLIYYRQFKKNLTSKLQVFIVLFIATSQHLADCFYFVVYSVLQLHNMGVILLFDL